MKINFRSLVAALPPSLPPSLARGSRSLSLSSALPAAGGGQVDDPPRGMIAFPMAKVSDAVNISILNSV